MVKINHQSYHPIVTLCSGRHSRDSLGGRLKKGGGGVGEG